MTENPSPDLILDEALQLPDPAVRAAYLLRRCGGDPALRTEVESLLAAYSAGGSFLEPLPATGLETPGEQEGDRIGRYKLLELIGEGGFGRVWMAEQLEPVKRRVALKIVKLGMDTREVLARFEAERQALAMMDHPHIASVFDGGATATGRPYFVMELVKGLPLTQYCKDKDLDTNERLALFIDVCAAVQHAHQKGIIHRDLKPSNILVSPHDGKPVVKVIDFGIAKAIGMELTEKTVFTRLGRMLGTPQYMSPEQAELNALDVDTLELEASKDARAAQLKQAEALRDRIVGGTPFAEAAREVSKDNWATDGGDRGKVERGDYKEPLNSAIFALQPGTLGIHDDGTSLRILKVEDRVEGEIPPLAEVRADIAGILQRQQRDALLQQLEEDARVKVDAWEKEHKPAGKAADGKEKRQTQGEE